MPLTPNTNNTHTHPIATPELQSLSSKNSDSLVSLTVF